MTRFLKLLILAIVYCASQNIVLGQSTIKGKIIDENNSETLIGASVIIQGTTEGTTTDFDGNFQFQTLRQPPIVLEISYIGYQKKIFTLQNFNDKITIRLSTDDVLLKAVEVVDLRISEKQKQEPLTVETMDVTAIKEAASGNFYESLGTLKGVDMTSASLGFKVINTRGFNSTSPVRSLQLIDGVDNQSPGLNFSLGNFLGASDLDVMKVDIVAGASSAYYGPGAFNGVINMTTKDPFMFPGLSASVKLGERNMREGAIRWAQVLKNKDGKEKFGYKFNIFYMEALDWEAENYDPVFNTRSGRNNPGGYDAVNRYGDEVTETNNDYSGPQGVTENPGLGYYHRTGYNEIDLADYNTRNLKLNAAFHYKIKDDIQAIFSTSYSNGTTIFQGDNRYSLKDIQFYQNRLEIKKENKFFIRAYATHEDAGNSYDIVTTALRLQDASVSDAQWNSDYKTSWTGNMNPRVRQIEGFPNRLRYPDFINERFDLYPNTVLTPFLNQHVDSLNAWHIQNRMMTDTSRITPRFEPGTERYDSAFNDIRSRKFTDGGSLFFDRSALYHVQAEYKFTPWGEKPKESSSKIHIGEFIFGGNARWYRPNSQGTIFSDTLTYTRERADSINANGDTIVYDRLIDSNFTTVKNFQYGLYFGFERKWLDDKLKTTFTLRMDKNENFDYLFSPALSFVYSPNTDHTFRATYTSAIRNPTMADMFLYYNVGRAILLGNLNGYDSLVTVESFNEYRNSLNPNDLEYFSVAPIKPEEVQTIEFGYRGIFNKKLFVDASYYHSWYRNFIGFEVGLDVDITNQGLISGLQAYRLASNAQSIVTTQGFSIGGNYYFAKKYSFNGNYSWNKLVTGDDDPIIPAFNTPEHKYNIGISGRDLLIKGTRINNLGFGINYKWIQGFIFEGSPQFTGPIDSYDLVDAQINYTIPKIHSVIKVGASNLLNNRVYQVYGGPRVGRLAYISIIFDWDLKSKKNTALN